MLIFSWAFAACVVVTVQTLQHCPAEWEAGPDVGPDEDVNGNENTTPAAATTDGYPDTEHMWLNITESSDDSFCALTFARRFGVGLEVVYFSFVTWLLAVMSTLDTERMYADLKYIPGVVVLGLAAHVATDVAAYGFENARTRPTTVMTVVALFCVAIFAVCFARDWLRQFVYSKSRNRKSHAKESAAVGRAIKTWVGGRIHARQQYSIIALRHYVLRQCSQLHIQRLLLPNVPIVNTYILPR